MNIFILGHTGMLGHMLVKYLTDQQHTIHTVNYRFPSIEFKSEVLNFKGDFIINAIGAIPQKTNSFEINHELPVWLSQFINSKIIHAGTDCESDSDAYGISKKIARDFIVNNSNNTKILRTSIIGPEVTTNASLLNWFLNNTDSVNGYTEAMWNGITTLEWAKQCMTLMNNWDTYNIETIISSPCISKFELLNKIKLVFDKNINILPVNKGEYKCLSGDISVMDIEMQLHELKKYYYDTRR